MASSFIKQMEKKTLSGGPPGCINQLTKGLGPTIREVALW